MWYAKKIALLVGLISCLTSPAVSSDVVSYSEYDPLDKARMICHKYKYPNMVGFLSVLRHVDISNDYIAPMNNVCNQVDGIYNRRVIGALEKNSKDDQVKKDKQEIKDILKSIGDK